MIQVRKASERGHARHGWLESDHSFSFANYYDPDFMGIRSLRVINEDRVQPSRGFGRHSHADMEILSYVISGALEHRDSMGNGSVIRPGEIQLMRAGTGVTHSEFNHSDSERVHFLQIWIVPEKDGLEPSYDQRAFSAEARANELLLIASPDGEGDAVQIAQDVRLYTTTLDAGAKVDRGLAPGRFAWVQVVHGRVELNDTQSLGAGDGAAMAEEVVVSLVASEKSEVLVFDLG